MIINLAKDCGLTIRSTGPIAACRHLARHFILGQIPPHRNGPVSSNVSHHQIRQYSSRRVIHGSHFCQSNHRDAAAPFGCQFMVGASRRGAQRRVSSIGRRAKRGEARFASVNSHRTRVPQSHGQCKHNSSRPSNFMLRRALFARQRLDANSPHTTRAFAQHRETSPEFKFNQLAWLCFPPTVASTTVRVGASAGSAQMGAG